MNALPFSRLTVIENRPPGVYTRSMAARTVLLSFVGNRDPYVENTEELGPVLSLLQARPFARVFLFCTGPDYLERARMVEQAASGFRDQASRFTAVALELDSPVDYEEIFVKLRRRVEELVAGLERGPRSLSVLLDPGTPQMQTAWFLLVRSGLLAARLLQGVPPRFAGGTYKVREVDLSAGVLPEVRPPEERLLEARRSTMPAPPTDYAAAEAERPRLADYAATEYQAAKLTRGPGPEAVILRGGERLVGQSPGFLQALEQAQRIAAYDITVLIRGETGTGKGLLARYIHESSARAAYPFVAVNCATIAPALAESELFGHLKGAFTGADRDRPGKFRSAEGGTVLLDEVGDLPPEIQPKLLRTLEERTVIPVGADAEVRVNVRILAATNQDLPALIEAGRFRRDLYERLNQFTLRLPALRERHTDIPLLLRSFLEQWNARYGEDKRMSEEALGYLLDYPWPGNVRELGNSVTAMCAMSLGGPVPADLLPPAVLAHFSRERGTPEVSLALPAEGLNLRAYLFQAERRFYQLALERALGNREKAAQLLGLNAPAFRKALRERFPELVGEGAEE